MDKRQLDEADWRFAQVRDLAAGFAAVGKALQALGAAALTAEALRPLAEATAGMSDEQRAAYLERWCRDRGGSPGPTH